MSDLMQHVEIGTRTASGIRWDYSNRYRVPGDHRRHILNREHEQGITPSEDGWLWCAERHIADDLSIVTRIRWDDLRWYAPQDRSAS